MKFAVDRSLDAKKYEDAPIGQSLQRVMKYWTLTGKFTGVHPELAKIGVTEVKFTDQGLEIRISWRCQTTKQLMLSE